MPMIKLDPTMWDTPYVGVHHPNITYYSNKTLGDYIGGALGKFNRTVSLLTAVLVPLMQSKKCKDWQVTVFPRRPTDFVTQLIAHFTTAGEVIGQLVVTGDPNQHFRQSVKPKRSYPLTYEFYSPATKQCSGTRVAATAVRLTRKHFKPTDTDTLTKNELKNAQQNLSSSRSFLQHKFFGYVNVVLPNGRNLYTSGKQSPLNILPLKQRAAIIQALPELLDRLGITSVTTHRDLCSLIEEMNMALKNFEEFERAASINSDGALPILVVTFGEQRVFAPSISENVIRTSDLPEWAVLGLATLKMHSRSVKPHDTGNSLATILEDVGVLLEPLDSALQNAKYFFLQPPNQLDLVNKVDKVSQ